MEQRRRLYDSYNDAVNKYKASKDSSAYSNARKKIDGEYRGISAKILERQSALAKDQPESADKVKYSNKYIFIFLLIFPLLETLILLVTIIARDEKKWEMWPLFLVLDRRFFLAYFHVSV